MAAQRAPAQSQGRRRRRQEYEQAEARQAVVWRDHRPGADYRAQDTGLGDGQLRARRGHLRGQLGYLRHAQRAPVYTGILVFFFFSWAISDE